MRSIYDFEECESARSPAVAHSAHLEDFQVAALEFAEDGGHGDFSEE